MRFQHLQRSCSSHQQHVLAGFVIALGLAWTVAVAGEETEWPDALRPWASDAYTVRFFLKVEPPPAAGATGVLPEPEIASLYLPLKQFPTEQGGTPRIEQILLLDETGQPQPIFMRPVAGGNEIEVAFPTRLARRRYCLYAGAAEGKADQASPQAYEPRALTVRARGYSAPGLWRQDGPALDRQQLDQAFRQARQLGEALRRMIYDADPPFSDSFRRDRNMDGIPAVLNDRNYAALYEGYLRAPLSGTYHFAVNTFGIVDLQVDGVDVLSAGTPDTNREPFQLTGQLELRAGIHRVTLRYAQAGGKSGVYLLWRLPGKEDFIAVPGQAFPRALPAVVALCEERTQPTPFVHTELAGFYRTEVAQGIKQAKEWVMVFAQAAGADDSTLRILSQGVEPVEGPASGLCAAMPAGQLVEIECVKGKQIIARRNVLFPTDAQGGRDLLDLTGELVVKEAPRFLYPDETAQFHFESHVSPVLRIIPKQRYINGPEVPHAFPAGQFRLMWRYTGLSESLPSSFKPNGVLSATPDLSGRMKIRLPMDIGSLEPALRTVSARLQLTLTIGGIVADQRTYRLLHSKATWKGRLEPRLDGLVYLPEEEGARAEEPLFILPREDQAAYRRFQVGLLGSGTPNNAEVLFLGDPLVEPDRLASGAAAGLSTLLASRMPQSHFTNCCLPGPHRGFYIFRILASVDELVHSSPGQKIAPVVVVSLGTGDVGRQTPGYDFERGLDLLVDRLRAAGAERILVLGVLPLPDQEKASRIYQERVNNIIRQQHLGGVDLVASWLSDPEWVKRFRIATPEGTASAYAPVPNAETLDQLADQLVKRLQ